MSLNFQAWEEFLQKSLYRIGAEKNYTLEDAERFLSSAYKQMPPIPALTKRDNWHIPIFQESQGNLSVFHFFANDLPLHVQKIDNNKMIPAILLYCFLRYPKYCPEALEFWFNRVSEMGRLTPRGRLLYMERLDGFRNTFRKQAQTLFFSAYHAEANPFLYAYMKRNGNISKKKFRSEVDLFLSLNRLRNKYSLGKGDLLDIYYGMFNEHRYWMGLKPDFSQMLPFFSGKNQDTLKTELFESLKNQTIAVSYDHEKCVENNQDAFGNYLYPFKVNTGDFPPAQIQKDGKPFAFDERFAPLFDDTLWDKVVTFPEYYRNTPCFLLGGASLSEFLGQRELLRAYQNGEHGDVLFSSRSTIKYPPMPVNLYWILADAFRHRDNKGNATLSQSRYHDFLNPAIRAYSLKRMIDALGVFERICAAFLDNIHEVELADLFAPITIPDVHTHDLHLRTFMPKIRHNLKEISGLFAGFYRFPHAGKSHSAAPFISWDRGQVEDYGKRGIIMTDVFACLYQHSLRKDYDRRQYGANEHLNAILLPVIWMVMCLQKWKTPQNISELDC